MNAGKECPYILEPYEKELMEKIKIAKQIPLWSYGAVDDGEIGGFVPIAMMQDVKKIEVEDSNQEVNKRLSSAIKRLV